ncbi:hypothetical protein C8F01DRAFT_39385 [Mycena amicta]|nr:hypothetical protein C8F01DRAFT_39385 [Mycena amicta]
MSSTVSIGPSIPAHLLKKAHNQEDAQLPHQDDDNDPYAPPLPPDMLAHSSKLVYDSESDDDDIGPHPLRGTAVNEEPDAVPEFMAKEDKRRKQVQEAAHPAAPKRDEWMLVPPTSSGLLGTLDPTKLSKGRQFSRGTASERSAGASILWTETPVERQQRLADEVVGKKHRLANASAKEEDLESRKRARIDDELRQSVAEHTRRMRGPALVDMHSMASDKDDDTAIWDRNRDMGVGGQRMDAEKRNRMIKDAKGLGDRFSRGSV